MSLLRAAATVSGLTLASRVFGLVRDIMAAAIMGAGPVADAFFVALRLPNFFRRMTAEGAFSVSFVPLFTKSLHTEGRDQAQQFANEAMAVMLAVLIPFCVLAIIFMPFVLGILAPGFSVEGGRYDLAITLTRITFFYLLFMSLTALVGGMLNAIDKFAAFATAPVLFNVMQIAFLLIAFMFPTPGHAMAWGVLVSGVLQFIWLVWCLRRNGMSIKLMVPKITTKVKRLLELMAPGMIGASAVQINLLVDTIIASFLPIGAVSFLYYADRLVQLPLGLIGTAVGTALLPKLAERIAQKKESESMHLFNRSLEWTFLLTIPASVALVLIAEPVIHVLFQRGAFDLDSTTATARALQAYALGLPAFVGIKVLSTALYAQEDTKTPVKVTLICAALNIVLCLALIGSFAHVGIALATTIAGWIQVFILGSFIHRKNHLNYDAVLKKNMMYIILASIVMGVVLMAIQYFMAFWLSGESFGKLLIAMLTLVGCGGAVYGALVLAFGVLDMQMLKTIVRRRKKA